MASFDSVAPVFPVDDVNATVEWYAKRRGGVWDAYIHVYGIKDLYESVREEATIVQPLRQQPYGNWEFEVKDPNGYILVFSEEG